MILEDVLTNLERVSDHCSNVAVEMVAIHEGGYDTHEIFNSMSEQERASYDKEYKELKSLYRINGKDDKMKKKNSV